MQEFEKFLTSESFVKFSELFCLTEYLGIHFENNNHTNNSTNYMVSVPESSKITDLPDDVKEAYCKYVEGLPFQTSDELIEIAKKLYKQDLQYLMIYCYRDFLKELLDSEITDELIDNSISSSIHLFVKVRKGDIWTQEKGEKALSDICERFSYREV